MRNSLLALSLLSTSLLACSDETPAPSDVRARIAHDLRHILTETKSASAGSTENLPTASVLSFATGALETSGIATVVPMDRIKAPKDRAAFADGDEDTAFDPDALVDLLNQQLFTDANHLGDGIYRVPASLVCGEPVQAECGNAVAKAELRVRVAEDEGLRFWIQIDKNHDEPLGFLLRKDELAVTLNLDDASDAMIALAEVFGQQAPNAALAGEVTGSLKIVGAAHALARLSFDRPISVKLAEHGVNLDSPNAFRFESAAAQVLAIELDGTAPKAKLDLGLGETRVHVASEDDFDLHPVDIFLAGATVNATFEQNTLTLDNLSLGAKTSTVTVNGQQGLAIDLNGNSGRKLTATITADPATGTETLTVAPRFDLRTTIDHAVLGDEVPVYDVTHVLLEGSLRSSPLGDRIEVRSGRFYMETNPAEYGFVASAGDCVFATENYDDETFTSWTSYSVGACASPLFPRDGIDKALTRR